ncbi:hypothetical protein SAMD00019534_024730 [Acytostelium subglobosum LB1]|uniref:hypothetical protein n=1 Tax=Acytostelium subglobosum LB1 TaxID=1410327 RepID=UPI000644BFA1|nr:hypothetical protein SAMD00019534_024730 [Acytostelium subglobosum LB1]GAM19298.1 hypothetical protein SAMD00019534_024730 [Acytostelium subglobosum LB1]|eukprot:XP_012757225.1 hypothetical protein SAMD00019534_024730 [Acytostelium subglobosum LB1]
MRERDMDTRCINMVFHNHLLVSNIIGHVSDIHKRWMSLPKPSIRSSEFDNSNNNRTHLIKSTIKGQQLQNMSLVDMLRFNATQMFIAAFDSVADDFPIDYNNLLISAVNFNNTTVFNHLIDRMNIDIECDNIIYRGNFDILRSYLAATGHRALPNNRVSILPYAVETGNVEFVRLLLQLLTIDVDANKYVRSIEFHRRGVRVDMLRMLHGEFNCLFELPNLWEEVLRHSVKCNMMDSVQYILDNMSHAQSIPTDLLTKCLRQCAKTGNVDMFQAFIKTPVGTKYLINSNRDMKEIIEKVVDNGHLSIIKHLFQHHVGNGHISEERETQIRDALVMPPSSVPGEPIDMDLVRLRSTPLADILNDNIVSFASHSGHTMYLTFKMCTMMSKSMATFISSPRMDSNQFRFCKGSLYNMVRAVVHPGSNITADIVCQFIVNCDLQTPSFLQKSMKDACGYSAALMQLLKSHFNIDYIYGNCLATALENRCHETMSLIFNHTDPNKDYYNNRDVKAKAFDIVSKATLPEVTFILDHMDNIRHNAEVCEWAACSPHMDVFEHVINLFTREQLCGALDRITERALSSNRVDNVRMLQRFFERCELATARPLERPLMLGTLHSMAKQNCYLTLEHYFNSTAYTNQPIQHRLRTLHSILNVAYQHSTHRVIKLCTDHIQSLTLNQSQQILVESTLHGQGHVVHQATSSMETAFHSVFKETKLGMMVMEQIGQVHKSLGINGKHLIKGSQLIDRHCLMDYIKYGATEWFLKSYSPSNVVHNSPLLDEALTRCDTRAVDVLMANPKCQLIRELSCFINDLSCSHSDFDRIFDQYVMINAQTSSALIYDQLVTSRINHPTLLRKLIQSGINLPTIGLNNIDNAVNPNDGWITKPWAVEMLELMTQHKLLERLAHVELIGKSIELNLTHIVHFNLHNVQALSFISSYDRTDFIGRCCIYGVRIEHLDLLLTGVTTTRSINVLLPRVLQNGHLEVANFIINFTMSNPKIKEQPVNVDDIHHSIISIDLFNRLVALPNIKCRFNQVLGRAIKAGNKEIIDKLLGPRPEGTPIIQTNHIYALEQAALVGDLDSIRRIMNKPRIKLTIDDLGALIDRVGLLDSLVTEDVIIELAKNSLEDNTMQQIDKLAMLMIKAASKSLTLIKLVVDTMSQSDKNIHKITTKDFNTAVDACINRGDNESLEFMVKLARTLCFKGKHNRSERVVESRRFHDYINLRSCNTSALNHLFDNGHVSVDDVKSEALTGLVDWACQEGKLDIMRVIHQRCTTPTQLQRHLPSMKAIHSASDNNHHNLLSYLFEGDVDNDGWFDIDLV